MAAQPPGVEKSEPEISGDVSHQTESEILGTPEQATSGVRRLLQVLADTEASDRNRSALQLHRSLVAEGWDVRTLALAPGRRADLAATIPVMAPSRRSLAAVSQFRTEQAWADIVLLRGIDCASVAIAAAFLGGASPKRILALSNEPQKWTAARKISRPQRFLVSSAAVVVVDSELDVDLLAQLDPAFGAVRWIAPYGGGSASGAPEVVQREFSAEIILSLWLDCLNTALPSRP